ncbi:MAG: hypothetical protein QNJ33_19245 [Crocosphaera sp.]|nr:hypothetical protein [Crocosphaera sp.]
MEILHTKGRMKKGQLILENSQYNLPTDTEVEVIIIVKKEGKQDDFDNARQEMQLAFKNAGITNREEILNLIKEVKQELFKERNIIEQ